MDEYLECYMSANLSKSKATLKTEKYNIKRVLKCCGLENLEDFKVEDFDDNLFMCRLAGEYEPKTILMTLFACKNLLAYFNAPRDKIDPIQCQIDEFVTLVKKQTQSQTPNKLREDNHITYDDLIAKVNEAIPEDPSKLTDKRLEELILMAFFTIIPPRRLGDYGEMEYRDSTQLKRSVEKLNKEKNYISHLGDGKYAVVINQYKTARRGEQEKLGQFSRPIDNDVVNKMLHQHFANQKGSKKWLFRNLKGQPIGAHALCQKLKRTSKRIVGKQLTCDSFRHIYLTHYQNKYSKNSIVQKQEDMKAVGQHYVPPTQELYVDIVNDN